MSVITIKRRLAAATADIISARDPDVPHITELLAALSELLTEITGEPLCVRITSAQKPSATGGPL